VPPRRTTAAGYERAHQLRQSPTPAESKLWAYLRGNKLNGAKFRRQHAIGQYIVDFCSPKNKLVLELDGSQHIDQAEYDAERTEFLRAQGYRVIRIWNSDVDSDIQGVMGAIRLALIEG